LVGRDSARLAYAQEHLRVQPGQRVLDVGCGTGDILQFLPPVQYVGYDLSQHYIARARRRFGQRGEFRCRAVSEDLPLEARSFDVVIAHGLLHHVGDEDARTLFRISRRALRPGGRLVTFDGCFTEDQSATARLALSLDRGRHVRERASYERLARTEFDQVRSFVRHDLLRIPYTHLIMECTA
jgi:cyclopropane fatty-acyl-phospholipid synthase-like methyltransferase